MQREITIRVATETRKHHTFASAAYLAGLMAELDRAEIKARLKQAREEAGLTQPELADALELHWRSVQNYESKSGPVPWNLLGRWAATTGRPHDWILHGDAAPVSSEELNQLRADLADVKESLERVEALLQERVRAAQESP